VTPGAYMTKARRAIASARLLLADGDGDGACNRAYYAMFDAAHAALVDENSALNPAMIKTHRGLIATFGERLIKTGRTTADLGRSLNQVEQVRLLADYTGEDINLEKAQWAIDQAERFISAVETLIS